MQDVQTLSRRLLPPGRFTTCTVWTLGSHRRLVRRWEGDTDLPKPGPFPQISHTAAIAQTPQIFGSGTWPGQPGMNRAKPGYRLRWSTTKTRLRCSEITVGPNLERWGVVGLGWGGAGVACWFFGAGRGSLAFVSRLGGDACGAVLGAGASALGHHRGALGAVVLGWVGFGGGHAADGV